MASIHPCASFLARCSSGLCRLSEYADATCNVLVLSHPVEYGVAVAPLMLVGERICHHMTRPGRKGYQPEQEEVVTMSGCPLMAWTSSLMGASTAPARDLSPAKMHTRVSQPDHLDCCCLQAF